MLDVRVTLEPAQADIDVLLKTIMAANKANNSGPDGYQSVGFFLHDESTGATTGGLYGYALYDWLLVQFLAVPEELRGTGIGTHLIHRAEAWARERGLIGMWLDTFEFGAPDFYRGLGFEVFATFEDHPIGSRRYFFKKRFEAPTA